MKKITQETPKQLQPEPKINIEIDKKEEFGVISGRLSEESETIGIDFSKYTGNLK